MSESAQPTFISQDFAYPTNKASLAKFTAIKKLINEILVMEPVGSLSPDNIELIAAAINAKYTQKADSREFTHWAYAFVKNYQKNPVADVITIAQDHYDDLFGGAE